MAEGNDKETYIENGRGLKLYCRYWEPKGKPKAIVFISHGFSEHSEYYETLGKGVADIGCLVFAHDHVGHGRSEGTRVLIEDFDHYVDDVFQHVDVIKKKYPELPAYYIGHSMGGAIGARAAILKPHYFKGIALSGPAVSIHPQAAGFFVKKLSRLLGWLVPSFPVVALDYDAVTRDEEILRKRKQDPLSWTGCAKAGWTYAMLKGIESIQDNADRIECPLLLVHGDEDIVCDMEGSSNLYDKCSSADKTIRIYPGARHNLLDEPEGVKEKVQEDITKWLDQRIK